MTRGKPELNEHVISNIVAEWFEIDHYDREDVLSAFQTWLREQREDAHIEALEGAISQLKLREEYLNEDLNGNANSRGEQGFYRGFRAARQRAEHAAVTLKAVYKNRRLFATRDAEKEYGNG